MSQLVAPSPFGRAQARTMKLKILHFSLLFAATTAKDVYFEDAATDSPGAEKVVPAAKLGVNESANHRRMNPFDWLGELRDSHVDGCQRGVFGRWLPGCILCEGDCDTDADCGFGLRCFQRDGTTPVPGCKGTGKHDWDYCTWRY